VQHSSVYYEDTNITTGQPYGALIIFGGRDWFNDTTYVYQSSGKYYSNTWNDI
jgi:hypothetical protein